jgi:hypothetical protein
MNKSISAVTDFLIGSNVSRKAIPSRGHIITLVTLAAIALALFWPVLFHTHWGLFDDTVVTIQPGRRFLVDPSSFSYALSSGMRSGLFVWNLLLWKIFPENPTAFYVINFGITVMNIGVIYLLSYGMSKNVFLSSLTAFLFFFSTGLFEVIFTLDKQESYLPLLFGVVLMAHMIGRKIHSKFVPALSVLIMLASAASYFTKETSAVLLIFSGSLAILVSMQTARNSSLTKNKRDRYRAWLFFLMTALPYIVLKYGIFPPSSAEQYVVVTFDTAKLLKKLMQYVLLMPDFFIELGLCFSFWIYAIVSKLPSNNREQFLFFSCCLLSALAATLALISFDSFDTPLMYIWLPIYVFILPALAYVFSNGLQNHTKRIFTRISLALCLAFIVTVQVPKLFILEQVQFAMDDLTSRLAVELGSLSQSSKSQILGAMPLFDYISSDIAENIECFVRSKLVKGYYFPASEKAKDYQFAMLNFLTKNCMDVSTNGQYIMPTLRGRSTEYQSLNPPGFVGWSGFQHLALGTSEHHWVKRPFGIDNLLIVPYGNLKGDALAYRGAGLFANDLQSQIKPLSPQLRFLPIRNIERKIISLNGGSQVMGWKILKVISAEPALVKSTDTRKNCDIIYHFDPLRPVMAISSRDPVPPFIRYGLKQFAVFHRIGELNIVELNLPHTDDKQVGTLRLNWPVQYGGLHIDSIELKQKLSEPSDALEICKQIDGWLIDNSAIIYTPELKGKTLILETEVPSSTELSLNGRRTVSNGPASHELRISLANGFQTSDGRFLIVINSNTPLTVPGDPRKLIFNVKSYRVL